MNIVKEASSARNFWRMIKLSLFACALLGLFCLGVLFGHNRVIQDYQQIGRLNESNIKLLRESNAAKEQSIFSQRQLQIQEEAYKHLNISYAGLEQKNSYLESRLNFYRSIISPVNGQSGPNIQSLNYRQDGSDVVFDLILVQAIKHETQVSGNLRLKLYQAGQLMAEWPASDTKVINFQYFEQISGVFEGVEIINDDTKIRVEFILLEGEPILEWFPEAP